MKIPSRAGTVALVVFRPPLLHSAETPGRTERLHERRLQRLRPCHSGSRPRRRPALRKTSTASRSPAGTVMQRYSKRQVDHAGPRASVSYDATEICLPAPSPGEGDFRVTRRFKHGGCELTQPPAFALTPPCGSINQQDRAIDAAKSSTQGHRDHDRTHSRLCHARHPCRRAARSDHRRARDADLPDHVLRVRRRRPRGLAVRPAGVRQHLHPHRQPDQRGAGGARRRARRRHRRPRGRLRPRRAGAGVPLPDEARRRVRRLAQALWRLDQPVQPLVQEFRLERGRGPTPTTSRRSSAR